MECNSENTSDANGVHLEGNFLFSLSFFVTRNRNFWPMYKLLFSISSFTSFPSLFLDVLIIDFYFVTGRPKAIFWKNIMEKSIVF